MRCLTATEPGHDCRMFFGIKTGFRIDGAHECTCVHGHERQRRGAGCMGGGGWRMHVYVSVSVYIESVYAQA